jgi:hypothetical protein
MTGTDAYCTLYTLIGIEIEKRIAGINGKIFGRMLKTSEPLLFETYTVYQFLKAALPTLGAEKAVEIMIAQNEFKNQLTQSFDFRIVRNNNHPFFCNSPAGWFKSPAIFNPDQTQSAYTYRRDIRTMAQGGNINTCVLSRF